jgi:hypothetical protein
MSRGGHLLPSADSPRRDVELLGEAFGGDTLALCFEFIRSRCQAPADRVARVRDRRLLSALHPRQSRVAVTVATAPRLGRLAAPAAGDHSTA